MEQNTNTPWEVARSQFNNIESGLADCIQAMSYLSSKMDNQALNDDLANIGGKADPLDRKRVVRDQYAISYLIRCMALSIQEHFNQLSETCIEYENAKEV
jgi:hypothetical protein